MHYGNACEIVLRKTSLNPVARRPANAYQQTRIGNALRFRCLPTRSFILLKQCPRGSSHGVLRPDAKT
jgi:hypothetical protein